MESDAKHLSLAAKEPPDARANRLWAYLVRGNAEIAVTSRSPLGDVLLIRMLDVPRPALDARTVEVLEHLLLGGSQKAYAYEIGVSASSVAFLAKQGLSLLGLQCLPSRAPVLLAVLVCLSRMHGVRSRRLRVNEFELAGDRYVEVVLTSATSLLAETLSDAESAVTDLLLAGKPYVEIAEQRRTSVRTVANQVRAAFTRLNISGRAQLMAMVARSACSVN